MGYELCESTVFAKIAILKPSVYRNLYGEAVCTIENHKQNNIGEYKIVK
jgi:hypothetical protein